MKQNWVRAINISKVYLQLVSKCIGISDTDLNVVRRQKFFPVVRNNTFGYIGITSKLYTILLEDIIHLVLLI